MTELNGPAPPGEAGGRKAKSLRPLLGLLPFLKPYGGMIALAGVMLVLAAASTLVLPLFAKEVTDIGFSPETRDRLARAFLGVIGLFFLLSIFSALRFYSVTWLGERVVADIRKAVFDHVTLQPPAFFEMTRTGEVLSRLTTDTTVIQSVVGANVSIALRNSLIFAGSFVMLFVTNWQLTLLFFAAAPFLVVPLVFAGRWVRGLSRQSQDRIADTSAQAGEVIQGMTIVQAYGQEAHERARFGRANEAAFEVARRRTRARAIMIELAIFLVTAAILGILWIGATGVIEGRTTSGAFVQFILYAFLVASSLGALAEVFGELQRAAGAAERLAELLAAKPAVSEPPVAKALPASQQPILFEAVRFAYPARAEPLALSDVSFEIRPGETVAFVGPSGAGKSTIFRLLLRFYEPQSGAIRIGGTDIRDLALKDLRARFALVTQDPILFSGTIGENIAYGRSGASAEAIAAAAKAAHAEDFIGRLAEGLNTRIGERGVTLSGGERQRVALARALLKDAPVLLLDEATASLDSETEAAIQSALERLKRGRTSLIIAHRLSTVVAADRIIVLDQGHVVATGTHAELVAGGGLYQRLANLQLLGHGAELQRLRSAGE